MTTEARLSRHRRGHHAARERHTSQLGVGVRDDVPWLEPDPNSRPIRALRVPDGAVDTVALIEALDRTAARLGVEFLPGCAVRVDATARRVTGVTLTDGTVVGSSEVVLATGSRTQSLVDTLPHLAAAVPRMCHGYGASVLLDTVSEHPPTTVLRTPNRAFSCGLHLVPRPAGTVYVGATNAVTLDLLDGAAAKDVQFLLDCATNQLRRDLGRATVRQVQYGNRPVSIDGYPLIGPTPSMAGIWLLTGTYRDGLHLSPLLAEHLANVLCGRPGLLDLDRFGPEREPLQPQRRDEVVAEVTDHILATGFEQPWHVTPGWPLFITDPIRRAYQSFADELDEYYTPPAEVLLAVYQADGAARQRLRHYYKQAFHRWHPGA